MRNKLKALFDSKTTWTTIGVVAGTLLGEQGAAIVNGLGMLVMAAL